MSERYTNAAAEAVEILEAVIGAVTSMYEGRDSITRAKSKAAEAFNKTLSLVVLADDYLDRQFASAALQDIRRAIENLPGWDAEEWGDYSRAEVGREVSAAIVRLKIYIAKA